VTLSASIERAKKRRMSCFQKISEASGLALNSALNIFSVPPTNVSVARSFYSEILPLSAVYDQNAPLQFRLFNDNLWTDMSRIYFMLELSIEKQTAATGRWSRIEDADVNVAPIQSLGQTFIQQLKVQIGNTDVYDSGTLYPYRVYLTNELSFPGAVKRTFLASTGYRPSTVHDSSDDQGFVDRCAMFAEGRTVQLMSRLDFDLGNQELYLLNNIDLLFTIYRAKDAFLLHLLNPADTKQYRVMLHSAKLYAKMIDVQPSLNMAIYGQLQQQAAKYAVRRTEVRSTYLSAGRREIDYNVFSAAVPRRLTIAFVASGAFNGDLRLSPFNFKPFSIRELSVQAGGQSYPPVPYNWDFSEKKYTRAYVDFYEALGLANSDRSCDISWDQYGTGWTIFVIPLTSTLDDTCGFELLRSGTTSIHAKFSAGVPAGGIEMVVLGEFDQLAMVDFNRRVLFDSNVG
jgi:hypothetical protein